MVTWVVLKVLWILIALAERESVFVNLMSKGAAKSSETCVDWGFLGCNNVNMHRIKVSQHLYIRADY